MRVLVTGAGGFVGRHVLAALRDAGHVEIAAGGVGDESTYRLEIRDADAVRALVRDVAPDAIVHLAGQASVAQSIAEPLTTIAVNAAGTANVLEAAREARIVGPGGIRVLVASSADVYGAQAPARMPLDEDVPLRPASPYAASKVAAETYAEAWVRRCGLDALITRAFNTIGPGQDERFAVAFLAGQLARIAAGGPPHLVVGNLEVQRDFLDVRDVAAAYVALLENGRRGEVYNICSGQAVALREVLRQLITIAHVPVEVRDDPERMRPSDTPVLYGDATKLRAATGWAPRYSLTDTLRDVYDDAQRRVAVGA